MRQVVLVVHNVRSAHNVGSLLRTADGLGVNKVYLSGYTPYPMTEADERLPHVAKKVDTRISKTALGAEKSIKWQRTEDISAVLEKLAGGGYLIAALEQTASAVDLNKFRPPEKIALIVGTEVGGVEKPVLDMAAVHLQIPMRGAKESFNVAVAGAIALHTLISAAI